MIDYVNAGGNIYIAGGVEWDSETERNAWADLLNAFGLAFHGGPGLNGLNALVNIASLDFDDPLFAGVTDLYFNNGNWVEYGSPNYHAEVFTYNGNGLFGISHVPEPATILLLSSALLGLGTMTRQRRK